jgi:hypothetical protein
VKLHLVDASRVSVLSSVSLARVRTSTPIPSIEDRTIGHISIQDTDSCIYVRMLARRNNERALVSCQIVNSLSFPWLKLQRSNKHYRCNEV